MAQFTRATIRSASVLSYNDLRASLMKGNNNSKTRDVTIEPSLDIFKWTIMRRNNAAINPSNRFPIIIIKLIHV